MNYSKRQAVMASNPSLSNRKSVAIEQAHLLLEMAV